MKHRENRERQYTVRFRADGGIPECSDAMVARKESRLLGLSRSDDRIIVFLDLRRTGYKLYRSRII